MGGAERSLWTAWTREGRGEAFEVLVRPHMRAAYEVARRLGCSHQDAEDCVQRALLQLVRERERGVPPVGVRAWLGRAVALKVKMLRRSSKRRSARERSAARPEQTRAPAPDTRLEVEAALRGLPDAERRAVVLRYLHDLDYAEMARALGASPLACRLRVHRALKRLQGQLGASGPAWLVALVALSRPARASALVPIGGALLMTTTGKLALGGAAVLATAAVFVGGTKLWSEDAGRLPPRAETAPTEVAAAERARKTAEAPPSPPDLDAVRESVEEARESASGIEELDELHEGVRALEEGLRLIEASEGREEAALKPDPITRRYLDELVAAYRRLPEGEERAGVLRTFGAAYKRYTAATGDRSLDVFLVEVLDRSAHKEERNAAAEALVGQRTPGPRLLDLMKSPHTEVRWRVASRLAWVRGDDRPRAIERLYSALDDKDPIVRWNAALGLGTAAPDARTFEAVLDRLAREEDRRVAYPLARAALKIDREAGRARLERMLPALPSETREMVSKALQRAE